MEFLISLRGIGLFTVAIFNFIFSLLIYPRREKKGIFNLTLFGLFSGLFAFISGGVYFFWDSNSFASILWYRATWLGVFILPPFVLFTYYFIGEIKRIKIKAFILYLGAGVISYLALTTNFFVKSVNFKYPNISGIAGPLDSIGRFYILICVVIALVNLLREYFKSTGFRKLQIKYFVLGLSICGSAGIIFTSIIPILIGESPYYDIVAYLSLVWVGLTTYAIVAKRLFEIKVILTDFLVSVMGLIWLIFIFLTPSSSLKSLAFFTFILFCLFGYYLIKAVHEESKRREEAEKIAVQEKSLRQKVERLARAREQFLLSSQHYFRTPLTGIRGFLELVLEGVKKKSTPSAELQRMLEGAITGAKELHKRIEESLEISRLQAGKGIFEFKEVQPEELLKEVIGEIKIQADMKKISLLFTRPQEALPKIKLDVSKMREALSNIVENAVKHTNKGKVVAGVEQAAGKNSIIFSVKDTGIGIPKEELEYIGTIPFDRGGDSKKISPLGKGIGLYLSRLIIESHKGKLWVESDGPGKGSTFYVQLPIRQ